ncbi:MAG: SpoIID/LytB domain-containing protein [Lachnospiraceae bacterium]|nr:SpoIID/LytB domain-containing protein [Lachnospiraceae bacterium]
MKDKVTNWAAIFVTTLFLPYCFTMMVSGTYVEQQEKTGSPITLIDEQGEKMDMETFLPYIIAGEIDFDYEEETLKAQAVIARTNLMRALNGKSEEQIKNLSLVYVKPEDFQNSFGEKKRERILNTLRQVVKDTSGQALTWDGQYIDALYHKISIGTTVSSLEMYGKEVPYLTAVESSQDVESEDYMSIKEITKEEAIMQMKTKIKGEQLTVDTLMNQLKIGEKTALGFVKTVQIGTETISGEDLKNLFDLPSVNFYLEEYEGKLRIITLGQGHCMGFSQYGANEMAKEEKGYQEILSYYYPGTKITKIK